MNIVDKTGTALIAAAALTGLLTGAGFAQDASGGTGSSTTSTTTTTTTKPAGKAHKAHKGKAASSKGASSDKSTCKGKNSCSPAK